MSLMHPEEALKIDATRKPAVSVIMPVYRGGKYLDESIPALLNQTFQDFELVIVDDGSPDDSAETIKKYQAKDARIHFIQHEKNQGIAAAMNTCMRHARGRYIARADHDDIPVPDRLESEFTYLEEHPGVGLVGGGYAPFNERGHRTDIFHPQSSLRIGWQFMTNMYLANPTIMFRREILNVVGEVPNVGAEDYAFLSNVVRNFRCINLKKILIDYREHTTNYSTTAKPQILESIRRTFNDNYRFYLGTDNGSDSFYNFHAKNRLPINKVFQILRTNKTIISKLVTQYHLSNLSAEVFEVWLLITWRMIFAILGQFKQDILHTSSSSI